MCRGMSSTILLILICHGRIGGASRIDQRLLLQPLGTIPAQRFAGIASHAMKELRRQPARAPVMQQTRQFASRLLKDGPANFSKATKPKLFPSVLGWELGKALNSTRSMSSSVTTPPPNAKVIKPERSLAAFFARQEMAVVQASLQDRGLAFDIGQFSGKFCRVTVNKFQGKHGVDIRQFDKWRDIYHPPEFLPTAKGIRLVASEWKALCNQFSKINAAPAWSKLEVEGDIFAEKGRFQGKSYVDIRRYVDNNDGEKKPTKQGAYMQQEQWSKLQKIAAQVAAALEDPPDSNCTGC